MFHATRTRLSFLDFEAFLKAQAWPNQRSQIMMHFQGPLAVGVSLTLMSLSAQAQHAGDITVIYSEVQSDPSSMSPGQPGFFIDEIGIPRISPDGNHWAIDLNINTATSADDEMIIVDGVVVVEEGTSPSWVPGGRDLGFIDDWIGINNSGAICFSADLSGDTSTQDVVFTMDAMGNGALVAQQGFQVNGGPAGWTHSSVNTAFMTAAGPGYRTHGIVGSPGTPNDELLMIGSTVFLQSGLDIPSGQLTGAADPWQNFDTSDTFVSEDGLRYLVQGDLTTSTGMDDVVVKDGVVVIQEGFPLPSGNASEIVDGSGIKGIYMHDSGNWMATGDFDVSNTDWMVYNGQEVAREGGPIFPGATENWGTIFDAWSCNGVGDFVVAGGTDSGDPFTDTVLVLNNQEVICRAGDPVDLDGNGLFDDDTFIQWFWIRGVYITDAREIYATVILMDGLGNELGDCFLKFQLPADAGVTFCDPNTPNSTGTSTQLTGALGTGVGSGLRLEANQGVPSEFGYFLVSAGFSDPGTTISNGQFCLLDGVNPFGRYNFGSTTNSIGAFDASGQFQNLVGTATSNGGFGFDVPTDLPPNVGMTIMSGETWNFQLWHRDTPAGVGISTFSNGLSVIIP